MKKLLFLLPLIFGISLVNAQEYLKMIEAGTYTVQEIQAEAEAYFEKVGTERGKGYKPYKRWEYQALRMMDENGRLKSSDFLYDELEKYNNYLNQNNNGQRAVQQGSWQDLGPVNWNATSGWNPGVGRVTAFAVESGNTNHIIIGANTGGVWRTVDGGANWTVLTDDMTTLNVYAVAMNPTNAAEYFWGTSNGVIFKSSDSGSTWNILADVGDGVVNKILIDPTNTAKMYCTTTAGIFKSTDSGANWARVNPAATSGYDIEFKPGDTNVIYASGDQFFKSTDGGLTFNTANSLPNWTQEYVSGATSWTTASANQNASVTPQSGNAMAFLYIGNSSGPKTNLVSPALDLSGASAPQLNFAYTQVSWFSDQDELRVLYKTSAAGAWIELASYTSEVIAWSDITLNLPNTSSEYYIAFEGSANYGRGVTLDNVSVTDPTLGTVFQDGFEASPVPFSTGVKMMAVSADNPDILYVLEESGGVFGGFYKSTDSGNTFVELDHGSNNYFGYSSLADDDRGQAPRDMDIIANPTDADEVHIAGILTWKSNDGGANFNITSQWTPGGASGQNIGYCHADVDIMEYVGDKIYVGSDGGLFVANNPATVNANYYTDLTPGLGIRQFYKIGISQSNPVIVSGGSQDNGTSVLQTNGVWNDWLGADGMETFVDKDDNNTLYGTSQFGTLYKSLNGGNNYFGLAEPDGKSGEWVTPFEQDPNITNTIYVGYDQVYKSTNGGSTWNAISQVFGGNLNQMKVAPSNSNVIFVSRGSSLFKTSDGGATNWTSLSGFSGDINSIAIHPIDANKVAIATTGSQKVYVSDDGGATWNSILLDLPNFSAQALVWEDNGNDGLYLGMNYGVYYTDNTMSVWQPFSINLPNVIISELEINTVTNEIYAATYGRGLWKSVVYDTTLSADSIELSNVEMHPNPATDKLNITLKKPSQLQVVVFDALGKVVYREHNKQVNATYSLNVSHLNQGVYFVKIQTQNGAVTKKLIVN
jgi:photosystem II stability/assembly factor-like uncharacterized protein